MSHEAFTRANRPNDSELTAKMGFFGANRNKKPGYLRTPVYYSEWPCLLGNVDHLVQHILTDMVEEGCEFH